MLTPSRALTSSRAKALPDVPELAHMREYGVVPRMGQVMMIAGRPGAMKSTLAAWWAAKTGLRTLYFSADMAPFTASTRLAACITGHTIEDVAESLGQPWGAFFEDALNESPVDFCCQAEPTIEDLYLELDAYVELWDAYPELLVMDNVSNVDAGMGEGYQNLLVAMGELQRIARTTGCAVFALHHNTEATKREPWQTQPRSEVSGKISQRPEIVLTVAYDESGGEFRIAPVKNRSGRADPTGETYFSLRAIPEKASYVPYPKVTRITGQEVLQGLRG